MALFPVKLICAVFLMLSVSTADSNEIPEPQCSKYAFEERVLEKLVRMEYHVQLMDEKLQNFKTKLDETLGDVKQQQDQLEEKKQSLTSYVENTVSKVQADANETLTDVQREVQTVYEDGRAYMKNVTAALKEMKVVMFKARTVIDTLHAAGSLIRFSTAMDNIGGAYNTSTGYFTAPYDGLYTFNVQICVQSKKYANIQIMAASNVINSMQICGYYGNVDCSSMDTVANLKAGNQVWVKCYGASSSAIFQDSIRWNIFSGMLNHRTM